MSDDDVILKRLSDHFAQKQLDSDSVQEGVMLRLELSCVKTVVACFPALDAVCFNSRKAITQAQTRGLNHLGEAFPVNYSTCSLKLRKSIASWTPIGQTMVRETHPELIFWRLNHERPLPSKKTSDGIKVRRELIRQQGILEIDNWLERKPFGTQAKPDDVLDGCAAGVVAREPKLRVPANGTELDQHDLKMEIWY